MTDVSLQVVGPFESKESHLYEEDPRPASLFVISSAANPKAAILRGLAVLREAIPLPRPIYEEIMDKSITKLREGSYSLTTGKAIDTLDSPMYYVLVTLTLALDSL